MSRSLYGVLGVGTGATEKDITKAFRAKARVLHPDKQPPGASDADKAKACRGFQELVNAYEVLSDATKRKAHDMSTPDPQRASAAGQQRQQQQQQRQQQQRQQQPPPASGRPASGAGGGRRQASGGRRRYVYADGRESSESESDDERAERRRRKSVQEEEDAREEERRKRQEEKDRLYEGLGSHWVKAPPQSSVPSRPKHEPWNGRPKPPTQTRETPMPKTKAKKKRRPSGGQSTDDDDCKSDVSDYSDTSSVLSFDIHINLKDYILNFEAMDPQDDKFTFTEVWTIRQPGEESFPKANPLAKGDHRVQVVYEKGLPVTSTSNRDSNEITKFPQFTIVRVLEFAADTTHGRIRARVEFQSVNGWVTLRSPAADFVKPLAEDFPWPATNDEDVGKGVKAKPKDEETKAAANIAAARDNMAKKAAKPCCALQ